MTTDRKAGDGHDYPHGGQSGTTWAERELEACERSLGPAAPPTLDEIVALLKHCSRDELRAFLVIARRVMGKGRKTYGPTILANDARNFKHEKAAEKADWIWYDALDEVAQEYDDAADRAECEKHDAVHARVEPCLRELAEAAPLPPAPDETDPEPVVTRAPAFDFDHSDEEPSR